jgi:ribosomal protein S18 acetylase RimI-like enzyme
LGVAPEHRGQGLGEILLRRALAGFQQEGLERVFLEVTAENLVAIHLYEQLGFSRVRTSYKAVDAEPVLK